MHCNPNDLQSRSATKTHLMLPHSSISGHTPDSRSRDFRNQERGGSAGRSRFPRRTRKDRPVSSLRIGPERIAQPGRNRTACGLLRRSGSDGILSSLSRTRSQSFSCRTRESTQTHSLWSCQVYLSILAGTRNDLINREKEYKHGGGPRFASTRQQRSATTSAYRLEMRTQGFERYL